MYSRRNRFLLTAGSGTDSRLWKTKNLLITPHVAGNLTLEHTLNVNVDMFCKNLINYSKGLPLNNLIDKSKGY